MKVLIASLAALGLIAAPAVARSSNTTETTTKTAPKTSKTTKHARATHHSTKHHKMAYKAPKTKAAGKKTS